MMMNDPSTVVVAMSGGVDSSVAAALLVEQGYRVIGMMLRLWSEPGSEQYNRCCTPDAMAQARRVAAQLGIPFYAVDAREAFHANVVKAFVDGYVEGVTPNPCLTCNRGIRWGLLLEQALSVGADYLATGHYVRLRKDAGGQFRLYRAVDENKDQSYVLSVLNQEQLAHSLFPLGEMTKPQVRQAARDLGLPVAERPESQDLCFLGNGDYRSFLGRHVPEVKQPGTIRSSSGAVLGEHAGLAFYTIGQRKGLGLASPQPLYVLEKDVANNVLIVGAKEELGQDRLTAVRANWVNGQAPQAPFRAQVKIRYKAEPAWGVVTPVEASRFQVQFDQPLRDITPGQAAVVYAEEEVLGGGIIMAQSNLRQTR